MSMDDKACASVRARFSELVEGDIGDDARREVEAHLQRCGDCTAALARFSEAIAALGRLSRPEPPADLPDRIDRALDRLDGAAVPPARPAGRWRMARHAVAALLVCGIIVGIIRVVPEVSGPHPARRTQAPAPAGPGEGFEAGGRVGALQDRAVPAPEEKAAERTLKEEAAPPPADEADRAAVDAARSEVAKKAAPAYREDAEAPRPEVRAPLAGARTAAPAPGPDAVEQVPAEAGKAAESARSRYAREEGEPGGAAHARAILLAARAEAAWVAAVRDLALSRPEDLATAWAGIDAEARKSILEVWRRATPPPGLAADLARAAEAAPTPAAREVIEALAGAARPPLP